MMAIRIRTVRHRGLKCFIEDDDERGIRPDMVSRVRRILTALVSVENAEHRELLLSGLRLAGVPEQ